MGQLSQTQAYAQALVALDTASVRQRFGDLSIIDEAVFETDAAWHHPCSGQTWVVSVSDIPYGPLTGNVTVVVPTNRAAVTFDISPSPSAPQAAE